MRSSSLATMNCSLAQTVEVIGDRWTVMILRDAFFGISRFDDFQRRLGVARNILADRLAHLVAHGVLRKRGGNSRRTEYELTESGWDLVPVLVAIAHWGDRHRPNPKGDRLVFRDPDSGTPVQRMSIRSAGGRDLDPRTLVLTRGPGLDGPPATEGESP